MAIDFPTVVYEPAYGVFARPVTFMPSASTTTHGELRLASYGARGIFNTVPLDVMTDDGSILSDQKTILDILETEFDVLPKQRDQVFIPEADGMPELGTYEITDVVTNGGGETTLTLRKILPKKP